MSIHYFLYEIYTLFIYFLRATITDSCIVRFAVRTNPCTVDPVPYGSIRRHVAFHPAICMYIYIYLKENKKHDLNIIQISVCDILTTSMRFLLDDFCEKLISVI